MVSKNIWILPDEVIGRILNYVGTLSPKSLPDFQISNSKRKQQLPIDNGLKSFAQTCSAALKLASPLLYRTISLELEGAEVAPDEDGDFVYNSKYQDVELRTVEAVLETSARTLAHTRVLDVYSPRFLPHGHMTLGLTDARIRRDNFMIRSVVRRLGEVDCLRIIKIPSHIQLSLKSLDFILRSLPSLRLLKAGNISVADPTDPEASVAHAKPEYGKPVNLNWLELAKFDTQAIPVILQTLRRMGQSLRGINIQPVSGRDGQDWKTENEDGLQKFITQNREFDFKKDPDRIVQEMREENRKISLPALEELWIAAMDDYQDMTDIIGHLIADCKKLTHVRLEFCFSPENVLRGLAEPNAPKLHCLRMLKCSWDNDLQPTPLDEVLPELAPLKTLVLSSLNNWDMRTVFSHRLSLKQLWLQCHASEQKCQSHFSCHMTADLFSEGPKYQFTSQNWPCLEELAVQYVAWEKIPMMHTLKALRLLSDLNFKSDCETIESYTLKMRAYVSQLWETSLLQHNTIPALELMIGTFDGTEVYFIITYDDVCLKRKHKGLKRPDEVVLTMIVKRLGMLAKGLKSVVIPRDIPLRMFVTILESIPNLSVLEAVIEPRTFYRESRDHLPYKSLLTTVTSLNLERLKFGFSGERIVTGMFRILERCCTTLRSLEISVSFYDKADFKGLENGGDEGSGYERPKLKFSALENLKIDMDGDGAFADWLLRLSTDFRKLSSLAIHAGQDTQEIVKYLISNGAPIHSLQLTDFPEKAYSANLEGDERRVNSLLGTIDRLDTLQLWSFDGWDLKTVYDTHRHTLRRLWLDCHISHNLEPGQICAVEDRLFRGEVDKYAFTTGNWPVLEELTMPWLGIDKLPLHSGLRVLRLEHLHTKSTPQETYKSLLEPYITSLLQYTAPAKPKLEVIVIMPNTYDRAYEGHDMTYLSISYNENGEAVIKTMNYMVDILKKHKWSYLFQEKTLARLWDDRGIWDLHTGNYYEGSS
ncbi:hypothetical protein TWF679_001856 [Orbilia oligospora]|uniref:Uncharacterized protein n=1 Tax=Orbilia oligospora TaxID=2813651 RepID=A0A8H8VGR4_ORBOL|nr:hypothetical protein TWF679_001856 [Orbilia oligospora]